MAATQWTIHGERIIDDTRRAKWSIAEVELPDGVRFEQYVYRAPKAAMTLLVVDDRVLMMHRHRFVIDRWVWELPGGYCDDGEDITACAAREAEEETGWRPTALKPLVMFQPWVATADAENWLFVSYGAEQIDTQPTDINEAEALKWIPLADIPGLIASGEIIGSASVIGLQAVLLDRG
ncbi:ADP-ribose pyrophosphatase YjhB (NUDIX family) [Stackebrandtia endophytica]|uniref:ADP-ribose pyrophosphatase YjhB (NUDIX family) n=1 Tax=Stackebrandtia endophytica TaxID=1496996 RepID=A0A543AQU1_9ACTN|nr:NUDIX domain-containing protein [Stackebrandtia endophytica]TQL74940.1 ADP-ribose pyrophosphatase YjhB (NUDIX family) [Stackebrandtia endophytica]